MKQIIIISSCMAAFFTSCEKVVDVNLNNASPQYVIEGSVYNGVDTVKVRIGQTTDYYGRAPQQWISDAEVKLSDDAGHEIQLPEVAPGRYEFAGFNGVPGTRYQLKVQIGENLYTAYSTMPQRVEIDSVSAEWKTATGFLDEGFDVAARFTDPVHTTDFYRLITTINDTLQNGPRDLYLLDDKYNNGQPVRADLFRRFQPGDKIRFELRTMDASVFGYFKTLNETLNNPNGPAPSNPNTNITGGALGYFGAFSRSVAERTLIQ